MKDPNANNRRLKELMEKEPDLTRPLVGKIVGMSRAAVDMWLRPPDTPNWRPMHDRYLRLLEFELGRRTPRYTNEKRYKRRLRKDAQRAAAQDQ